MECSKRNASLLTMLTCGLLLNISTPIYSKIPRTGMIAAAITIMVPAILIYSKSARNVAKTGLNKVQVLSLQLAKKLPFSPKNKNTFDAWISQIEDAQAKRTPEETACKAEEMSDSFIKATKFVGNVFLWLEFLTDDTKTPGGTGGFK